MTFYRFHSNSSTEKMTNIGVKGTHGRADSSLKAQTMQPTKKRNFFFFLVHNWNKICKFSVFPNTTFLFAFKRCEEKKGFTSFRLSGFLNEIIFERRFFSSLKTLTKVYSLKSILLITFKFYFRFTSMPTFLLVTLILLSRFLLCQQRLFFIIFFVLHQNGFS